MTKDVEKSFEQIDASKRATIKKLVTTAAFAAPVVSTFAIDGKLNTAFAGFSNTTSS